MRTLEQLRFDNRYARLPGAFFDRVQPTPLPDPYLVSFNPEVARLLDLDPAEARRPDLPAYLSGARLLPGAEPLAMIYSGHQFGHYVPRLGDGRAILLGELATDAGPRFDLHLKGAGHTLYSRDGDGRAVLRSTIREYLGSEAMHGLGVPTTRALCIVGSDAPVYRESVESAALLVRVAPSHVRFGSFEIFHYREQPEHLRALADFVIGNFFGHLEGAADRYARFYREVVERTARLVADWQSVGFAHGVMNSDNMSILGLTLDYGPFAFLDDYDPSLICNHSDHGGRYAFDRQPYIGLWNASCLGEAMLSLITVEEAKDALGGYEATFGAHYALRMRAKLGLREEREDDGELIAELLRLMHAGRVDYTRAFRALGDYRTSPVPGPGSEPDPSGAGGLNEPLRAMFGGSVGFDTWLALYRARLAAEGSADVERRERMARANPKYVLRNYLAQAAIDKALRRDYSEVDRLLALLQRPFDEQPEMEAYAAEPPEWGRRLSISCSS